MKIIHDCDPGNDDALAILAALGSPGLDLLAVTTGAGHLGADRTARNAAITLALGGAAVPVTRGASGPLARQRLIAGVLDFERGLDRERPELAANALDARCSASLIVELTSGHDDVTIVMTGPMTNLALALRRAPEIARRLNVVALAGAWGLGNKTAAAEWNILCDPDAADLVFNCGAPIRLIPIDAAAEVLIDDALVGEVRAIGGAVADIAVELLESLRATYRPSLFGPADAPLNDPVAILVAAEPGLARTVRARVDIELLGRHSYGRSVVDFAGKSGQPANCDIAIGFDMSATRRAFVSAIARAGRAKTGEG